MSAEPGQQFLLNKVYSSFLFAAFGWMLMERWLLQIGPKSVLHLILATMGFGLGSIAVRRLRIEGWTDTTIATKTWSARDFIWIGVLFVLGLFLGYMARTGWVTPFWIAVSAVYFIPWSRIPIARQRPFLSCLTICLGGALPVGLAQLPGVFIYVPSEGYMLWLLSGLSLVARLLTRGRSPAAKAPEERVAVSS